MSCMHLYVKYTQNNSQVKYFIIMSKTAPLSIRISPDLKKDLEELASKDKRSLSSLVEIILVEYIDNLKESK